MNESKNENLLSGISESLNPYKNYKTISEKQIDQWSISVTTDGVDIPKRQADRLIENTYKAAKIAYEINNGPIEGYEDELTLRFPKEGIEGLMNDLKARKELLSEDDDSQTAAVVHEMIHGIEENIPNYYEHYHIETITFAAEFMFGGESRIPYFTYLTNEVIANERESKKLATHPLGWKQSLQLLKEVADVEINLMNESAESVIEKISKVKRLEESDKISHIKSFIDQNKGSSRQR
jgi:hypothetical protein